MLGSSSLHNLKVPPMDQKPLLMPSPQTFILNNQSMVWILRDHMTKYDNNGILYTG